VVKVWRAYIYEMKLYSPALNIASHTGKISKPQSQREENLLQMLQFAFKSNFKVRV